MSKCLAIWHFAQSLLPKTHTKYQKIRCLSLRFWYFKYLPLLHNPTFYFKYSFSSNVSKLYVKVFCIWYFELLQRLSKGQIYEIFWFGETGLKLNSFANQYFTQNWCTAWKVSKYGDFSCLYFPVLVLNEEI